MAEWKLNGAFSLFVAGQFTGESGMATGGCVEADMVFIGGEIDKRFTIYCIGGHLVSDGFPGQWSAGANNLSDLLEDSLYRGRKLADIIIDG